MTREMIERIVGIAILIVVLGLMIWNLIGIRYAMTSVPFMALAAIMVEFGEDIDSSSKNE